MASLKEGISILYDMEMNNYLMTRTIQGLDRSISNLGNKNFYPEPKRKRATSTMFEDGFLDSLVVVFEPCFLICLLIGIIAGIAVAYPSCANNTPPPNWFVQYSILICPLIGMVVGYIVAIVLDLRDTCASDEQYERQYLKELKEYEQNVQNDERRVKAELARKKALVQQRTVLQNKLKESKEKLRSFYVTMEIDKDFRYLVVMGYMNDFIRLGIATKLGGADGLYYLVRKELRMDRMQASLEQISQKLDEIIDNQHQLYGELQNMNRLSSQLLKSTVQSVELAAKNNQLLENINLNTKIDAYNSERLLAEAKYQNFMLTWVK